MHSCSALGVVWGGVGCDGVELGADAASLKGSKTVLAQIMTIFAAKDLGHFTNVVPIVWKRRVNQQEIHQLSIKGLSANHIVSWHFFKGSYYC